MESFGDYYLPGRAFEAMELDKFLEEKSAIGKIWLEENTEFDEICLKHSFRKVESRRITTLDLEKEEELLWSEMMGDGRRSIRKAKESGVSVRKAEEGDLEEFIEVYVNGFCSKHNMGDSYIATVPSRARSWISGGNLFLAFLDGKIIAGTNTNQSRFLEPGGTLVYSSNTSLIDFQKFYPNELLLWEIIKQAKQDGFHTFNMCGGNLFKRKFSKMDPMIVNEWVKRPAFPSILLITSGTYFRTALQGIDKEYAEIIEDAIFKLGESGIYAEVEEEVDCLTKKFYRTRGKKFDFFVFIGIDPIKENRKYALRSVLGDKARGGCDVRSIYFKDIGRFDFLSLLKKFDPQWQNEKLDEGAIECSFIRSEAKEELGYAMEEGEHLRVVMLIRCLLVFGEVSVRDIFELIGFHQNFSEVGVRISNLLSERSLLDDIDIKFIQDKGASEELYFLTRMAVTELGIKPEEMKKISNMQSEKEIARALYLMSDSIGPGRIFLNLCNGNRKFGSVADEWIINNFWKDDMEVLEHWTKISPEDHESWQVWSRALWNEGLKEECARVAVEGLEFHPNSPQLLRRKAHGHRQRGENSEAVEIETRLFEENSDQLILIDTITYLVRGLASLREWVKVEEYSEIGLSIDPEHSELKERRNVAREKIKKNE